MNDFVMSETVSGKVINDPEKGLFSDELRNLLTFRCNFSSHSLWGIQSMSLRTFEDDGTIIYTLITPRMVYTVSDHTDGRRSRIKQPIKKDVTVGVYDDKIILSSDGFPIIEIKRGAFMIYNEDVIKKVFDPIFNRSAPLA